MSGLSVHDLTVKYGDVVAVDSVSVDVPKGELIAVVGPSGSGKSSLLAAIAGIVAYTGSVTWNGEDLSAVPVHRRGVGLVFQDGQLFPHRSVAGNVGYGLELAKVGPDDRKVRVDELLDLLGLSGLEDRGVDELSGGERQRVALARSLAPRPRVLLLDEPLSSLDAALRDRLAIDVRDILASQHTTGIVVTHDMEEARTMASRIVRMGAGRIVSDVPD